MMCAGVDNTLYQVVDSTVLVEKDRQSQSQGDTDAHGEEGEAQRIAHCLQEVSV